MFLRIVSVILFLSSFQPLYADVSLSTAHQIVKKLKNKDRKANLQFLRPVKTSKYYFWIDYFTKREKERFQRYINNGFRHKKIIERIFASYELPKELFYVGMIESGYYMRAKSSASAVGPWQFIKDTARRYGLIINQYVDERIHLIKATHAAARYFRHLYNIFGSWELALAAYNSGEYGLVRRIKKYRTKNFYRLSRRKIIPPETRNYIPKVLAAMAILERPQDFGFSVKYGQISPYRYTKKVRVKKAVKLSKIASHYGISTAQLKHLNPDLKSWRTPQLRYSTLEIHVPTKKNLRQVASIIHDRIGEKRKVKLHRIKRGETLYQIAQNSGTTIHSLRKVNNIEEGDFIRVGQLLKIPVSRETHVVQAGENLTLIAKKYSIPVHKIMAENKLSSGLIHPGQELVIATN